MTARRSCLGTDISAAHNINQRANAMTNIVQIEADEAGSTYFRPDGTMTRFDKAAML